MTKLAEIPVDNIPNGEDVWNGIGNFRTLSQVIYEFADDSISNLRGNAENPLLDRRIRILLENHRDYVDITIIDGGTGIRDLQNMMTLAGRRDPHTVLNAYGFGSKHALASAGTFWRYQTRTAEQAEENTYAEITGPYRIGNGAMHWDIRSGSGLLTHRTGTAVNFHCPWAMFTTLNSREKHNRKKTPGFLDLVAILEEDLRYTYSAILMAGEAEIEVTALDTDIEKPVAHTLKPLIPLWAEGTKVDLPTARVKLDGKHPVRVTCRYGLIQNHPEARFRYKRNSRTAGVEISIHGRIVESGILSDIWGANAHNSHNGFLVQVNLETEDGAFLPPTQSAKTEFRRGDPRLDALFSWIHARLERIEKDSRTLEKQMLSQLADKKRKDPSTYLLVKEEHPVFKTRGTKMKADLLLSTVDTVQVYEAKAGSTKAQDVHQLRASWDGLLDDGIEVTEGLLIAARHPEETLEMLAYMTELTDPAGRPYNFRPVTWQEENIHAPCEKSSA